MQNVQFIACATEILKCLKFPHLNLVLGACADTVTEGVVHSVYKVVTWSCFGVIR